MSCLIVDTKETGPSVYGWNIQHHAPKYPTQNQTPNDNFPLITDLFQLFPPEGHKTDKHTMYFHTYGNLA